MNQRSTHNNDIIEQFTKQSIPFTQLSGHFQALELLVKMANVNQQSKVLDVACGPGLVALEFAKTAHHVECLDLTPAMLEQAKKQALNNKLINISFQQGDAMALPYQDNTFDVVVTRYSFHHFLQPEAVLTEMTRVCKPGGKIVVADVAIDEIYSSQYNHIERLRDSSHVKALSPTEFERLFTQHSFSSCSKAEYGVEVELEEQLRVSFPKEGDTAEIRKLVTQDIGLNHTGLNPKKVEGDVYYYYPISVYAGIKKC